MKQLRITTQYWKDDDLYFAYTAELDIISQGQNYEGAGKYICSSSGVIKRFLFFITYIKPLRGSKRKKQPSRSSI